MMKREKARERLAAFEVKEWKERRKEAIWELPLPLKMIGIALNSPRHNQYEVWEKELQSLSSLESEARSQLFSAFFPQCGEYINYAYEHLLPALPYQSGYSRRAFRSGQIEHYQQRRQQWLQNLFRLHLPYNQPLDWYAAWAPYISSYGANSLGIVFAAAIDMGDEIGEKVFEILCDCARGEHDIGTMGRHVTRALLVANRPEGWQLMENMLVAAQRQEGLRQVILETVDEAHPQAFARMLRVVVEQNMVRFSATVRAADVWFGLGWTVDQKRWVQASLEQVLELLEHPDERAERWEQLLESGDANRVFVALWVEAFEDVAKAIASAKTLLQAPQADYRFVAAYALRQFELPEAKAALHDHLNDEDLRVAVQVFRAIERAVEPKTDPLKPEKHQPASTWFEQIESFLERFTSKETQVPVAVWPWMTDSVEQGTIADALWLKLGDRPIHRILPYVPLMKRNKMKVAERLIEQKTWNEEIREAIFGLISDRSSYIREGTLRKLKQHDYVPSSAEAQKFEALLTRKAADLRRGAISLLLKQTDELATGSAQRLLDASKAPQRLAGLELLDQLQQAERVNCHEIATAYMEKRPKRSGSEQELLDRLLAEEQAVPTLEDALGLAPMGDRTPPVAPQPPKTEFTFISASTEALLKSLDELIMRHRTTPITIQQSADRDEERLLGNVRWFPNVNLRQSREENLARLPLATVWQTWWEDRPKELKDADGLELSRAIAAFMIQQRTGHYRFRRSDETEPDWVKELKSPWFASTEGLQSPHVISLLLWLEYLYPPPGSAEIFLQAAQSTMAKINQIADQHAGEKPFDWRINSLLGWLTKARAHRNQYPEQWTDKQIAQLWQLLRWLDEPNNSSLPRWKKEMGQYGNAYVLSDNNDEGFIPRQRPSLPELLAAFEAGAATRADVYEHLLGERQGGGSFPDLQQLTSRKPHSRLQESPALAEIVEKCRDRILQIELTRGELPTAATYPALRLSSITGTPTVIKLLQNFGNEKFARGWLRDSQSKSSAFSHLFRVSFPDATDTPASFAKQVKAAKIKPKRLVELAVYAPQWARYIEHALGWKDLTEAVWWFHAHTKDKAWQVPHDIRELWSAQIAELTPLSSRDLIDGAVDVGWFQRIYKVLSTAQWKELNDAAKYASGGGGHKRAQLFAEAMTGKSDRPALIKRITAKRHQDAVRALGLMPLEGKTRSKKWKADAVERYQIIQEFLRTSRKFGSQRKASEKLAARIGLENLARTAGYPDPQRLEWAMEKEAIADLAKGPVTVAIDEVTVSLSLTEAGEPKINVAKKGKALKAVPAKLRKKAEIKELQERKKSITRQASRMRKSLEAAMCRGDEFTGAELKELLIHPILQPVLERLVFVDAASGIYGYPIGKVLVNHDGQKEAIATKMSLRIAHSIDLARSNEWHHWQAQCFSTGQVQPFKQIFRELYVLNSAEQQGQGKGSVRYAGHQVNPRQAVALLGQRGWIAHPEEGIRRTFHDENLIVWIDFEEGWYTPTEVEGLTLDQVCFINRKDYKTIPLDTVPPRVFSEVMRDLDLVVSVAHQGGVDPEASASTVEMRASLLRETSRLLKLENITLQEPYALIEGTLGSYTLHLGSATVHRQPGGALCIVPVRSQHRGRIFLPFADDDPKTAEVVSKALLLAKDDSIQDPTILEQLL